jgi:hypothetical protein
MEAFTVREQFQNLLKLRIAAWRQSRIVLVAAVGQHDHRKPAETC